MWNSSPMSLYQYTIYKLYWVSDMISEYVLYLSVRGRTRILESFLCAVCLSVWSVCPKCRWWTVIEFLRGRRFITHGLTIGCILESLLTFLAFQNCCQHLLVYDDTSDLKYVCGTWMWTSNTRRQRAAFVVASVAVLLAMIIWLSTEKNTMTRTKKFVWTF